MLQIRHRTVYLYFFLIQFFPSITGVKAVTQDSILFLKCIMMIITVNYRFTKHQLNECYTIYFIWFTGILLQHQKSFIIGFIQ